MAFFPSFLTFYDYMKKRGRPRGEEGRGGEGSIVSNAGLSPRLQYRNWTTKETLTFSIVITGIIHSRTFQTSQISLPAEETVIKSPTHTHCLLLSLFLA